MFFVCSFVQRVVSFVFFGVSYFWLLKESLSLVVWLVVENPWGPQVWSISPLTNGSLWRLRVQLRAAEKLAGRK